MQIFSKNIGFNDWGEIYLGLKKGWITRSDLFAFCQKGYVIPCGEDRLAALYLAEDESFYQLIKQILGFISEARQPLIDTHAEEFDNPIHLRDIPQQYARLWQLEFLLRTDQQPLSAKDKMWALNNLWSDFGYPEAWRPFQILTDFPDIGSEQRIEALYKEYQSYLGAEVAALEVSHKIIT
ncbi:MAG: DUF2247 family protein [Bacteroidia bacterium]|nr:DUF2247 family protein [Bacteroidia bacterium]